MSETLIIPIKSQTRRRESHFHFPAKKTEKLQEMFVTGSTYFSVLHSKRQRQEKTIHCQKHAFKKHGVHLGE